MLTAFHTNWTRPFAVRNPHLPYAVEPSDLLVTALSALVWRQKNGPVRMICDSVAARYYESLGLCFLWNGGVFPLLDRIPADINASAFWAAGKLFALSAVPAPCVMLDTDFICWETLSLSGEWDAAAIHTEELSPDVYPGRAAFSRTHGFALERLDWTVRPFNTALTWFGNDAFRKTYTDTAIRFMRASPEADDTLTYMVFAEQRLLSMCAVQEKMRVCALSDLPALFNGAENSGFTHIWGFKQQMRENPALCDDFCRRCALHLKRSFPGEAARLAAVPVLSPFF